MTFLEMKTELYRHVGRDDSDTEALFGRGINAGIITATLLFEPPESSIGQTVAITANDSSILLSSNLTRYLKIYNAYTSNASGISRLYLVSRVDYLSFLLLTSTGGKGLPMYYSLEGDGLYFRPSSTSNASIHIRYLQRPERVVNDSATIPFENYEEFIMAFATEYYWATQEEAENQQVWQRMADRMGLPLQTLKRARKELRKEVLDADNV